MMLNTISDFRTHIDQKPTERDAQYKTRLLKLTDAFNKKLDSFERPLFFQPGRKIFEEELAFAQELQVKLKLLSETEKLTQLNLKVASLQYRIKAKRGGLDPIKDDSDPFQTKLKLLKALQVWKDGYDMYFDKSLTQNDIKKINALGSYPEFVNAFIGNKKLCDEFFKIIIRDNFPIKLFVQYIKTCSIDLKRAYLIPHIGYFKQFDVHQLQLKKDLLDDGKMKDLRLLINRKFVTILDDAEVIEMNGGEKHTWQKIKEIWAKTSKEPPQVAMFCDDGMLLWKPQGLGHPGGKVDTTQPRWWLGKDMPKFLELTKERVEDYFGIKINPEKPFVARVQATCEDPNSVYDAHGQCTIAVPNEDGTLYRILPLGKYATRFPLNALEYVDFITNTVDGVLTYPDPGPTYTHRLQGGAPHLLTREQGETLLTRYGKEIWYFQFAGNNCSCDHQVLFEEILGKEEAHNYFRTQITNTKHTYPGTSLLSMVEELPAWMSLPIIHGIHVLLGSKRKLTRVRGDETKTESLYDRPFVEDQVLYSPGHLVLRILDGTIIPGKVWFGID